MFTVIICDKHIIEDCCQKYQIYFNSFLQNEDVAFCAWNTEAQTLDEALPDLKGLIHHKKEWNALIVNDCSTWGYEGACKSNPFDFVCSDKKTYNFSDFEQVCSFRRSESEKIDKALINPLTKLSMWLCGTPAKNAPQVCYDNTFDSIENFESAEAYYSLLNELSLRPSDVEYDWCKSIKFKKISENFDVGGELFNPPKSVVTISERAKLVNDDTGSYAWSDYTEFDYSQFYIDNLYSDKLRYILFDITYVKGCQNENLYFNFLSSVLLLATYGGDNSIMRSNRVYKLDLEVDVDCLKDMCNIYYSKLCSTISKIDDIYMHLDDVQKTPVDDETAEVCFESDVKVPINVFSKTSKENLKAKFSKIGLSKDCPEDEYDYWYSQYYTINKYFIRFLREPRRAIRNAAKVTFRQMNRVEDDRALRLSEHQKENIKYVLEESERNMLATKTTPIFNTESYYKKMREADKEIRRGIGQRMTQKETLLVGIIAVLAYVVGFLPLIFGNFNNSKSLTFSLVLTAICISVFAVVGIAFLIVLRKRLINRFIHFNFVMSGILNDIENGVETYSEYLSHACNVMRDFSVLNCSENNDKQTQNILSNHKHIICERINGIIELFSMYVDVEEIQLSYDVEPYDYDFTVMEDYEYEIPRAEVRKEIDYLQDGNKVVIPVDFIKSVKLTREELYD